jgi:hypothetical protein
MKQIIVMMVAVFAIVVNAQAVSVDVDGWNFTTDLDQWRTSKLTETMSYDDGKDRYPTNYECEVPGGRWKGTKVSDAFVFPSYPNAPKDNKFYDASSGSIDIYVLKIPENLLTDLQDQSIAIYGSEDKIPETRKKQDMYEILKAATRNTDNVGKDYGFESDNPECFLIDSEKDITFNNRPAHLTEAQYAKDKGYCVGTIAVLLGESTMGVIDVYILKGVKDQATFKGQASDVINSFTISSRQN